MSNDELAALVAEKVMGQPGEWHDRVCINGEWAEKRTWLLAGADPSDPPKGIFAGRRPPPYPSDIRAAWEVRDRMHEIGETALEEFLDELHFTSDGKHLGIASLSAEDAARRICIAACEALGVEIPA